MSRDTGRHRGRAADALMKAAEVVEAEEQPERGDVVPELLGMGVRESGVPAHAHAKGQIVPFHVAGRDVFLVRAPRDRVLLRSQALGWAVPMIPLRGRAVDLDELREVDIPGKGILYRGEVHSVAVRRELNSVQQTAREILHEFRGTPGIPRADQEAGDQLGVGVHRGEGPEVAVAEHALLRLGHVLRFGVAEGPDLVHLKPLAG